MPSTPTSKAQVQAYRFVLRRMEGALTRGDAMMLHEPHRSQLRALVVGLAIGALALGGFAVLGLINKDADWKAQALVLGQPSSQLYVVIHNPDRLVPVPNLASGRLVLAAAAVAGGGAVSPGAVNPTAVNDTALNDAPRTPAAGIADAPSNLPAPDQAAPDHWAVCDTARPDPKAANPVAQPVLHTTVVAGPGAPGRSLGPTEALLLTDRSGQAYLVFDNHRARVDLIDSAVTRAFGLDAPHPRPVTTSLLNAIPEGPPVAAPGIANLGGKPGYDLAGQPVGGVVKAVLAGEEKYFIVLADGVQEVPSVVANLELSTPGRTAGLVEVTGQQLGGVPTSQLPKIRDAYPPAQVSVLDTSVAPSVCSDWRFDGQQHTSVTVTPGEPTTRGATALPNAERNGDLVDDAVVPGSGLAVRSVAPEQQNATNGPIVVVSPSGTVYGVPDTDTAKALGLGDRFGPAPDHILSLLRPGPDLTRDAAQRTLQAATAPG